MKKASLCIAALLLVCSCAFAGPFGIEMGWTLDQCKKAGARMIGDSYVENGVTSFFFTPPKMHSSFDEYIIRIDDVYGVYDIAAYSGTIDTAGSGSQIKSKFVTIRDQIAKTYGEPLMLDYLDKGSIWDEPQYWMMGLVKGERHYSAMWFGKEGDPVMMVFLRVEAKYSDEGEIILSYSSKDSLKVSERQNEAEASVF